MKKALYILFYTLFLFVLEDITHAQVRNLNTFSGVEELYYKNIYKPGSNIHASIRPYDLTELSGIKKDIDTLFRIKNKKNKFVNNLLNGDIITIESKKTYYAHYDVGVSSFKNKFRSRICINPLINATVGIEKDNGTRTLWEAGAGVSVVADITKNLSFDGDISLNQAKFQRYLYPGIAFSKAVPGMGYAQSQVDSSYRFLNINLMAAFRLSRIFKLEAGIGKHFIGDGYRSLILSWNTTSYPYLKLTTDIWKFKYINLYTLYNDSRSINSATWKYYQYKFSTTHILSLNMWKRLNVGFFETVIWNASPNNDDNRRYFDLNYLNPVIFYRPVEFSLGSSDNVLMGFTGRLTIGKRSVFYGQVILDEFVLQNVRNDIVASVKRIAGKTDNLGEYGAWTNKQGYQLGYRHFDLFGIKRLNFLTELNVVRPYTYSHRRPFKNYSTYGQALAHPLGANFFEGILSFKYNYKRWFVSAQMMACKIGLDSTGQHNGQDIFKITYDTKETDYNNIPVTQLYNVTGQGISTKIINGTFKTSYLINPAFSLRIEAGITLRSVSSAITNDKSLYVFAGIKSGLDRFYRDY